ncbi:unnamed protein product, partial [Rotaria socialis]
YNLKANDAILAGSQHKDLNETILRDYPNHQFVAGGSTQNSMRAATWILQQPGVCVYTGCVGQDKYHQLLHDAASKSGLTLAYGDIHKARPSYDHSLIQLSSRVIERI